MIYIDPPYNTGNDFVYDDDFAMSSKEMDEAMGNLDEDGNRLRKNLDTNPRYHSDWCSMMYSRLLVARTLLANDGVIFISIDDNEVHHLRKICDEVFGAGNFVADLIWANNEGGGGSDSKLFRIKNEHILVFGKCIENLEINGVEVENKDRYSLSDEIRGKYYLQKLGMGSIQYSASLNYAITCPDGTSVYPEDNNSGRKACWRWSQEKLQWGISNDYIVFRKDKDGVWIVYTKQYLHYDNEGNQIHRKQRPLGLILKYSTTQGAKQIKDLFNKPIFDYPKDPGLLHYLVSLSTSPDSLILDFFSGSATTAHAVMQLNAEDRGKRKYICVQIPEETPEDSEARKAGYNTICEIGKERIRRAGAKIQAEHPEATIDTGFRVLRLDSSNMEEVYFEPATLSQENIFAQVDSVKYDRTELDLLFGCMVDWGVQLSYPLRKEEIAGKHLHIVNEGALVACFDKEINIEAISHIAEMKPLRVIFRESCFATDADKLNIYEQFKQLCGWNQDEVYKRIHVI